MAVVLAGEFTRPSLHGVGDTEKIAQKNDAKADPPKTQRRVHLI